MIDSTKPPPKPKKPKKQKENSENENSIEVDEIKAEDSVEDKKLNETTKKASRTVNNAKKFSYTYRLSYTCTLTLFKLIYRYVELLKYNYLCRTFHFYYYLIEDRAILKKNVATRAQKRKTFYFR